MVRQPVFSFCFQSCIPYDSFVYAPVIVFVQHSTVYLFLWLSSLLLYIHVFVVENSVKMLNTKKSK